MKILLPVLSFFAFAVFSSDPAFPLERPRDSVLDFARSLMVEGEYYRAITEFKRVLFFADPEEVGNRTSAILGIGEALQAGKEHERAGEWIYRHLDELEDMGHLGEGTVLMCRSFLKAGVGDRLLTILATEDLPNFETEFYRALALANTGAWADACDQFLRISSENPHKSAAAAHADLARRALDASWKNPKIAAWLGIIPGLGYFYAGHKRTGIVSVVVNSIFAGATYEAFDSGQDVLGGFLALFSISWYASNVYGSGQAARRHNRRLQESLWLEIRY